MTQHQNVVFDAVVVAVSFVAGNLLVAVIVSFAAAVAIIAASVVNDTASKCCV